MTVRRRGAFKDGGHEARIQYTRIERFQRHAMATDAKRHVRCNLPTCWLWPSSMTVRLCFNATLRCCRATCRPRVPFLPFWVSPWPRERSAFFVAHNSSGTWLPGGGNTGGVSYGARSPDTRGDMLREIISASDTRTI